jgi:hypothetical protein
LKKTGLDITAFQAAQERAQTEMRRLAQEQKQQAIKESASVAARLRPTEKSRLKTKRGAAPKIFSYPQAAGPIPAGLHQCSLPSPC